MTIEVGQHLPGAVFTTKDADGVHEIALEPLLAGRSVVIFAVPGAFTPTCSSAHLPGFIKVLPDLKAKGVDQVICLAVNDPHVMAAWAEATGADGITMLCDAECQFTEAIGMRFDAPQVGLVARSLRYSILVRDGVVMHLNTEVERGVCNLTGGEAMLDLL